jgi:hypothetical protein
MVKGLERFRSEPGNVDLCRHGEVSRKHASGIDRLEGDGPRRNVAGIGSRRFECSL